MENHKLVLPGHLNHFGFLFGGNLLKWVDEFAWIAASLEYPGYNFVTIALDKVEFRQSVRQGAILEFAVAAKKAGRTSLTYGINVFRGNDPTGENILIFSTNVTLVRIDAHGNKLPLSAPC